MSQHSVLVVVGLIVSWLSVFSNHASAQLVQVRPGYVRAPFVRVYSDPYGTYVRAPFVSIYSPRRPLYQSHQIVGATPQREHPLPGTVWADRGLDLSNMDTAALWKKLPDAASRLHDQLSRIDHGESWQNYLHSREIGSLKTDDTTQRPTGALRDELRKRLRPFDATLNSPQFRQVTRIDGFQEVRAVLAALISPRAEHDDSDELQEFDEQDGQLLEPEIEELPAPVPEE